MGPSSTTVTRSIRNGHARIAVVGALVAVAITLGVVAVFVGGDSGGSGDSPSAAGAELVPTRDLTGQPLPAETFETLGGATASLEDYRGRPLVLNFFASWCAPCIREMPAFEEAHQTYGDRVGFLVLAVNDTVDDTTGIVEDTGVTYDLGRDPLGDILAAVGGIAMPTTVFVAADGTILEVQSNELSASDLEARITRDLLG